MAKAEREVRGSSMYLMIASCDVRARECEHHGVAWAPGELAALATVMKTLSWRVALQGKRVRIRGQG